MKKFIFCFFILFVFFVNYCQSNKDISFNCVEYCLESFIREIQVPYEERKEICEEECIKDCLPLCISYFKKNYIPEKTKTDLEICQEICY